MNTEGQGSVSRALVRELASFFNDLLNEDCPDYWPNTERWAEALIPEIEKRCREAAAEELEKAAEEWGDNSREWYYEHRYDKNGIAYACGFEDGWNHARQLARNRIASLRNRKQEHD